MSHDPYLDPEPTVTLPTTEADGATKLCGETLGAAPSTATNLVDGTSFSVYLVTSIAFPAPSRADLREETRAKSRDSENNNIKSGSNCWIDWRTTHVPDLPHDSSEPQRGSCN